MWPGFASLLSSCLIFSYIWLRFASLLSSCLIFSYIWLRFAFLLSSWCSSPPSSSSSPSTTGNRSITLSFYQPSFYNSGSGQSALYTKLIIFCALCQKSSFQRLLKNLLVQIMYLLYEKLLKHLVNG
jgi:hypothetical protein